MYGKRGERRSEGFRTFFAGHTVNNGMTVTVRWSAIAKNAIRVAIALAVAFILSGKVK